MGRDVTGDMSNVRRPSKRNVSLKLCLGQDSLLPMAVHWQRAAIYFASLAPHASDVIAPLPAPRQRLTTNDQCSSVTTNDRGAFLRNHYRRLVLLGVHRRLFWRYRVPGCYWLPASPLHKLHRSLWLLSRMRSGPWSCDKQQNGMSVAGMHGNYTEAAHLDQLARAIIPAVEVYTGRLSPWLAAPHGNGADWLEEISGVRLWAMAIIFWEIYFLHALLTNLLLYSWYWGVTDPQVFLAMPFNVYNEENCIYFSSKNHTAGWRLAVRILARLWAAVAMMPWLWGGAAKEMYSHEDLYSWAPRHSGYDWQKTGCDSCK